MTVKAAKEIDRQQILKADSYEELRDKIGRRIEGKYKPGRVSQMRKVQKAFEKLPDGVEELDYWPLFKVLRPEIEKRAEWLEKKYKSVRLSYHDFEGELWKIAYEAIEYYMESGDVDTEFMLLETLEMRWKSRMIDFIRATLYTKKRGPWYFSISFDRVDQFAAGRVRRYDPIPETGEVYPVTVSTVGSDTPARYLDTLTN